VSERPLAAKREPAVDRDRADLWCERGILGLVLSIVIFSPLATGAVRLQDFLIVQWLMLATLAVWALRFFINPKHRLLWPPVCWPVFLFMGYAVVRYAFADIEHIARQEMIKVLLYGFLFFVVLNNLHRQETTGIVGATLILLGMGIAFYALVQFLTDSNKVWHFVRPPGYAQRGSGTFICPNNMAAYLEMLLPLSIAYTLTGRFTHVQKVFLGYSMLTIFAGIIVSVSRGAWVACGVALVVLFIFLFRQRGYRLQVAGLLALLVVIGVIFVKKAQLSGNRQDALAATEQHDDVRIYFWNSAVEMWKDHPLVGVGPAHFDHRFRQYRPANSYVQARPDRVHNDYLNTLADWGIIGGALVAAAWGLFYYGVLRSWKFVQRAQNDLTAKRSNRLSFVLGGALGLVAILAHSFVDFNMHIPANAILAVTLMALVAGHFRFATEQYWHTVRWPLRVPVMIALLAGMGYLGHETWKRTREAGWLARAEELPAVSTAQTSALERAFEIDNRNAETAYAIGENLRLQSWNGGNNFEATTLKAMEWFERAMRLNPYDPYAPMRYGMCLHWLRRHDEAQPHFDRALKLDPNSYYTRAHMGWHYVQLRQWQTAKDWMEKSFKLKYEGNVIALAYFDILTRKIEEERVSK
jgi:O-antigen ligase